MPELYKAVQTVIRARFLRIVFIVSLVVAVAVPVLDRFVIYPAFTNLMVTNVERNALRIGAHLATELSIPPQGLRRGFDIGGTVESFEHAARTLDFWKIRVFSVEGEILYSTIPAEIGSTNKNSYFFDIVAKGNPFTTVVRKDTLSLEGQMAALDVIETYVPLIVGDAFGGAFEIYYDVTEDLARMEDILARSTMMAFSAGVVLFLAVLWSLHRAAAAMDASIRAEQELRQAQKMRSLGGLAGGVAHEFNNMLLPIVSLTTMNMKDCDPEGRPYKRMEKVLQAAKRAETLVKQVLAFSHLSEVGEAKGEHDMYEIIDNVRGLVETSLPSNLKVTWNLRHNGVITVDPTHVETILMNLVSNAAHALEGRAGRIEVFLRTAHLSERAARAMGAAQDGEYACFGVTDDGPGMTDEVLARATDPFFTTKAVGEGTGLGLSMVQGIVTGYEGGLKITSDLGKGTTVEVFLPIRKTRTAKA